MAVALRIAGIVPESITDGPGIRYTIFVQGCGHRCPGCHNPHTWEPDGGREADIDNLWREIEGNPLLSGVTLSGGEPFDQAETLLPLARKTVESGLELAAYSGYTFEQLVEVGDAAAKLLKLCHVLVDGPFVLERRNLGLRFRGSDNQRILAVAESIRQGRAVEIRDGRWQE